jgi:crotonobetainyl-CoA:carnitine CoA-transferase CaiB-like acyl-CoA transferase
MAGALEGVAVLDLTTGAAGAIATMLLADHGARVERVIDAGEAPLRGGGYRVWDRGKRVGVVRCAERAAWVLDQLGRFDVLVEDNVPAERPGYLATQTLQDANRRAVLASITPYGEHGTLAGEPGIDDLILARTGVLAGLPGFRDGPIHCAHPLPSTGAGILAALGIVAALYDREATGVGRPVATTLVAGALLYHPKVVGEKLARHVFQTNPYGSAPFYSVYRCADDNWIQLGCVHPGFIARAGQLMGIADLLQDPVYGRGQFPKTPAADTHLRGVVADVMATRTLAEWSELLEANDVPFAPSRWTEEALDDPQIKHNGMVVALEDPEVGTLEQMGVPIKLSATPGSVSGPRQAGQSVLAGCRPTPSLDRASELDTPARHNQLPLAGVRVLEITNLIAGPIAGRLLADLGADVMKLEPPAGDISRPIGRTYFYSVNSAKRSIVVDTSQRIGKEVISRLARASDVILANLRPGATQRMGIGVAFDPSVVETQISGYGLSGPYVHRPGIDPLAQAMIGLERVQGGDGNPPSFPAQLAPTDFTTGAMAALGTVLALFARRRGRAAGQRVEVNLLDGGVMLTSAWFTRYGGQPQRPIADTGQHGTSACHRLYQCREGYVYVAADTEAARAALRSLVASGAHGNGLTEATEAFFAPLSQEEAAAVLRRASVPFAPVASAESHAFFDDPDTEANGWKGTTAHPDVGALTTVRGYVQFASVAPQPMRHTPLLGEHSEAILREAAFDDEEVRQLIADGIVLSTKL